MGDKYTPILSNELFRGVTPQELPNLLDCVRAVERAFQRDEILLLGGDPVTAVGLVLEGTVHVLREDAAGRQTLMTEIGPGELFGEALACAAVAQSPVTVQAAGACRVLFLDYRKLIVTCPSACPFHARLIENMLGLLAKKNLLLSAKIELLSRRTIRERLLAYFQMQGRGRGSFSLPFNREELAAYLCVDRSALSSELSRMQREGLIRLEKNRVTLSLPREDA